MPIRESTEHGAINFRRKETKLRLRNFRAYPKEFQKLLTYLISRYQKKRDLKKKKGKDGRNNKKK